MFEDIELDLKEDVTVNEVVVNDYTKLENKPQINNVELHGNKTLDELGIQTKGDYASKGDLPTKLSDLKNDSGFISEIPNESDPTVPEHVKNITEQDITNWNNKSNLDGNYESLSNKPTLFSGSYNDLIDKPTIPSNTSELTNDSGFLTEHQDLSSYATTEFVNTQIANAIGGALNGTY